MPDHRQGERVRGTPGGSEGLLGRFGRIVGMKRVNRSRKSGTKNSDLRLITPDAVSALDDCDCAACSGEEVDQERLIDDVTSSAASLVAAEDPVEVEIVGATFLSNCVRR
jgi:hypothetical protein